MQGLLMQKLYFVNKYKDTSTLSTGVSLLQVSTNGELPRYKKKASDSYYMDRKKDSA